MFAHLNGHSESTRGGERVALEQLFKTLVQTLQDFTSLTSACDENKMKEKKKKNEHRLLADSTLEICQSAGSV